MSVKSVPYFQVPIPHIEPQTRWLWKEMEWKPTRSQLEAYVEVGGIRRNKNDNEKSSPTA